MSLGDSIFARRLVDAQARRQAAQQAKQADQLRSDEQFKQNIELARFQMDQQRQDFDRKAKLAELHGKLASQEGTSAPKMGDARLQEVTDLSRNLETQRIPQLSREQDARYAYKLPYELMKTDRNSAGIRSREGIADLRVGAMRDVEGVKASLKERDIALKEAMFAYRQTQDPLDRELKKAQISHLYSQHQQDVMRYGKEIADSYAKMADSAMSGMRPDQEAWKKYQAQHAQALEAVRRLGAGDDASRVYQELETIGRGVVNAPQEPGDSSDDDILRTLGGE